MLPCCWGQGKFPFTPLVLGGRIIQMTYSRLTGENKILILLHGNSPKHENSKASEVN